MIAASAIVAATPRRPVRAAMILDGSELYGLPHAVANLLSGIDPSAIDMTGIFFGRGSGFEILAGKFPRIINLETGPILPLRRATGPKYDPLFLCGRAWSIARSAFALRRVLRRESFDVLHTHTPFMVRMTGVARGASGAPILWHCHGAYPFGEPKHRGAERRIEQIVAGIPCISRFVAETFPPNLRDRTTVLHNSVRAVDLRAAAEPGEFRRRFNVSSTQPLVGIFGAVVPIKGHRFFIEAAARVAREFPDARFAVVGGTTEAFARMGTLAELTRQIDAAGLADRVLDTGYLPDATRFMTDFDIIVMPSISTPTQKGEGFGMVLIEAMAQGVAVVSTRCGAPPEIIDDGVSGLLVPPENSIALADAMLALLRDPARRRALGQAGQVAVHSRFDASIAGRRLSEIYMDVQASGRIAGEGGHN